MGCTGLPARRLVALHRQDHHVGVRCGIADPWATPFTCLTSTNARNLPLGCHEAGDWSLLLSVRRCASPVPSARCKYRFCVARSARADANTMRRPSGTPHGLRVPTLTLMHRQARELVPRPLVNPDVGLSFNNVHGEVAAIGREHGIGPVRGRAPQRRRLSVVIHPVDRHAAPMLWPGKYTNVPLVDTANCAPPVARVRRHAFQHGHRRPGYLEPVQIEGRRKERPVVYIDQMAARQIPAVIASALDDLACARRQRLHHDALFVAALRCRW